MKKKYKIKDWNEFASDNQVVTDPIALVYKNIRFDISPIIIVVNKDICKKTNGKHKWAQDMTSRKPICMKCNAYKLYPKSLNKIKKK